jgi:hypothetical protein
MKRAALAGYAVLSLCAAAVYAQSTVMPAACVGKTGAQLDQCVRDIAPSTGSDVFETTAPQLNPRQILNCVVVNRSDEGFCGSRNSVVLECRKTAKYPDFDACATRLIAQVQIPGIADCGRVPRAQRGQCALRNKVFNECLKDPWNYFICLDQKAGGK